ncbi:MAG: hypothetical protein J6Z49_03200 [Kiritimatiellae bacterium]|nr:hypothetical protein [Kiritimatiellia bacterium]
MKRVLTAFAALAAAAAFADGISSANIVGYTTVEVPNQYTILAVNFNGIGGEAMSLNDAVPYVAGMTKGNNIASADQIQIQNATGGYDTYYMSNGKNAKGNAVTDLEGKWAVAGSTTKADVEIAAGQAFWYIRQSTENSLSLTVAGEIGVLATMDKPIDLTYKLIANPYPTDLPLNDGIPYVAGMTKGNNIASADQIQIQNATGGYDTYYMSNGKNAKGNAVADLEGKWAVAGSTTKAEASIPAGKGAWYIRKGSTDFEINVSRPYSL